MRGRHRNYTVSKYLTGDFRSESFQAALEPVRP